MASSSKKKTTMAKLNREARVRERRQLKKMKKDARKQAAALGELEPAGAELDAETPDAELDDAQTAGSDAVGAEIAGAEAR
jgi:hypothetical protein